MQHTIFVERIFDDKCFEALKTFCEDKINYVKLFCLTPANYHLIVAEQGFKGTKAQLSNIMEKRYRELSNLGCQIDLHIHLGLRLENIDQNAMFKEAMVWMYKHDFKPKLWTAGWYIYNSESIKAAKTYGLEYFNDRCAYSFHDYEYDKKYAPMMIITNLRGLLR